MPPRKQHNGDGLQPEPSSKRQRPNTPSATSLDIFRPKRSYIYRELDGGKIRSSFSQLYVQIMQIADALSQTLESKTRLNLNLDRYGAEDAKILGAIPGETMIVSFKKDHGFDVTRMILGSFIQNSIFERGFMSFDSFEQFFPPQLHADLAIGTSTTCSNWKL
jgi:hypothetical protein